MAVYIIAFILHTISHSVPPEEEVCWWIFFYDRGPDVELRLDEKTIELQNSPSWGRLNRNNIFEADEINLEPWAGYVEEVIALIPNGRLRTTSSYLNAVSVSASENEVREISRLACVSHIQPVRASVFEMPLFQDIFLSTGSLTYPQLSQLRTDELHKRGWYGSNVTIGVLDTGFNLVHEVFADISIEDSYDFINSDSIVSQQPEDPEGQANHGTAVLSILGGYHEDVFSGGAPAAEFILAKTEDISDEYQAEEDYWVAGLEWLDERGAELVSSSLGYLDWYSYEDLDGNTAVTTIAADAAASRGLLVFNAIGNGGPESGTLIAPSDGDSVFAVGAVTLSGEIADFSSRGPTFDGRIKPQSCALGVNTVLAYQGEHTYNSGNGTSFATPLVASVSALLLEAHPEWSMFDVMDALLVTASNSSTPDNMYGHGVIDAYSALLYRSVTGSVRWSLDGSFLSDYPLEIEIAGLVFDITSNNAGYFSICPGVYGDFVIRGRNGFGEVIEVSGNLDTIGVEVEVFVDSISGGSCPSVFPSPCFGIVYFGFDIITGPADVSLDVFDLTGERIYTSQRESLMPGSYRAPLEGEAIMWDCRDKTGEAVASGVYIARFIVDDRTDILKFSVIR